MRHIKILTGLTLSGAAIACGLLYSGIINVGASSPHHPLTQWLLHTAMQRSVAFHASDIKTPDLNSPQRVMEGFDHYREMCVGCHLAPGVKESEIRQGLTPRPPKLQEAARNWQPNELFWIIKNGVKMTGMPAWGTTHSDEKIWDMVVFLQKLQTMSAKEYRELDRMAEVSEAGEHALHGHTHADEGLQ
jgi:mono/diheme cytochrome c family protein